MTENKTFIYGKHAVTEALKNTPLAVMEVFMTKEFDDSELISIAKKLGVLSRGKMPQEVLVSVHQGVAASILLDRLMLDSNEFLKNLSITENTCLVLLAELQDPQNVGAVIRSAAALGASGVLIPEHNQAQVTGTVVKVSAGMAFRIPIVSIGNVNTTIRDLKERGFSVYGLSGDAKHTITKEAFEMPTVFVLGNEAEGIREKTRELCDKILKIPMHTRAESLNAAASAAVALYAWSAKHPKALVTNK